MTKPVKLLASSGLYLAAGFFGYATDTVFHLHELIARLAVAVGWGLPALLGSVWIWNKG